MKRKRRNNLEQFEKTEIKKGIQERRILIEVGKSEFHKIKLCLKTPKVETCRKCDTLKS